MATPATESGIHIDKELLRDGPELPNARSSIIPREQNACRIDRWLGASRRVRSASLFVLGPVSHLLLQGLVCPLNGHERLGFEQPRGRYRKRQRSSRDVIGHVHD